MKYTLKRQLTFIFIGLITSVLVSCIIINLCFLDEYYLDNKEKDLQVMYKQLEKLSESEVEITGEIKHILQGMVERKNITFLIQDSTGEVAISTANDQQWLQFQLVSYLFDKNNSVLEVIESTDDYEIVRAEDPRTGSEYLEMWGYFGNSHAFLLRSPMESIQESAQLANRFLLQVGGWFLILSALLIGFISKKISDPILELAQLSKRMADLDFEAKYTHGGENEIGILGSSFNVMSDKLKTTISELKTANNELQQDIKNKEKQARMRSDFLSNVSHELKTPIALIQGYAEGLKEGIIEDPESRDYYCEVIMDEADKMNKLVRNLLELNHLENASEELQLERFNIVEIIQGVLQSLDIVIQQKECRILLDFPPVVYVWGDQFKVELVLRNYLTNALNHLDEKKVIQVKIEQKDNARISVFNTGKAIPEEDIQRVWEKFYKVDKARTREYGGNGIGLSIVKAIMESFQQQYGVRNYDNGVEFWFELDIK